MAGFLLRSYDLSTRFASQCTVTDGEHTAHQHMGHAGGQLPGVGIAGSFVESLRRKYAHIRVVSGGKPSLSFQAQHLCRFFRQLVDGALPRQGALFPDKMLQQVGHIAADPGMQLPLRGIRRVGDDAGQG